MSSVDPIVYFFIFGVIAGLVRSSLRLPPAIYNFVSGFLLLSIGLKGGVELAKWASVTLIGQLGVIVAMGVLLTLIAFQAARWFGKLERTDASVLAAHYGSVSVGTFAVAVAYLSTQEIAYEPQLILFLVVLEVPGILVALLLARHIQGGWGEQVREIICGRSIALLIGGLIIGWASGPEGVQPLAPFFFDLFKGVLAIFLIEMGLVCALHARGLKDHALFLTTFAIALPLLFACIGMGTAALLELSTGGAILLATLAASASYIAAPASMRTALPQGNVALALTASIAITFPFNVIVGIPVYEWLIWTFYPA